MVRDGMAEGRRFLGLPELLRTPAVLGDVEGVIR
jgi:hypothetical protein